MNSLGKRIVSVKCLVPRLRGYVAMFCGFWDSDIFTFSTWEFGRLFSLLHMSHLNWQWSSDCLFVWWWIKNNGITHNRWNLSFDKIGKLILARCVSIRFIRTLFFLKRFRITPNLKGRYRDFLYTLFLPIYITSLIISITHWNGTFFTKDECTLTRRNHSKSAVYLRGHSWCCICYGFEQIYYDMCSSI